MPLDEQSAFVDPRAPEAMAPDAVAFHQRRSLPNGELPPWGLADFHAYLPEHKYVFVPTREMWPAPSVNALIPPVPLLRDGSPVLDDTDKPKMQSASSWLDKNRAVQQMSWAPGLPEIIDDKLMAEGGWIGRSGAKCFNLYRPPSIIPGDASCASPWVELVRKVYPDDSDHIIKYFAHRVQRPHEKINHALVLGGVPGIGKDSILEPVKRAVGPWNFSEPSPQQVMGRFNGFVKAIIMRVSEARDLGEFDRYKFYEHMKVYLAAPPDVLRVDEKYMPEHTVLNVAGVIITTNHKTDGIYLPADDRRHYVAWSDLTKALRPLIGTNFILGMTTEATSMSPASSPLWTCQTSTARRRHSRRQPFGKSSSRATLPKTPNLPTRSTTSETRQLSDSNKSFCGSLAPLSPTG